MYDELTELEREVLRLRRDGVSFRDIAERLNYTTSHICNVYRKAEAKEQKLDTNAKYRAMWDSKFRQTMSLAELHILLRAFRVTEPKAAKQYKMNLRPSALAWIRRAEHDLNAYLDRTPIPVETYESWLYSNLGDRERTIAMGRANGRSLRDLSLELGLSGSYISTMHTKAKEALRYAENELLAKGEMNVPRDLELLGGFLYFGIDALTFYRNDVRQRMPWDWRDDTALQVQMSAYRVAVDLRSRLGQWRREVEAELGLNSKLVRA